MINTFNFGGTFLAFPWRLCGQGLPLYNINQNTVTINGVTWATKNVACPKQFTENNYDSGLLYPWGFKIGWTATDPILSSDMEDTWVERFLAADNWDTLDDPSPLGFCVPTLAELNTLKDTTHVTDTYVTNYNGSGVDGRLYTDTTWGNSIFIPFCDGRNNSTGALIGSGGRYWASNAMDGSSGWRSYSMEINSSQTIVSYTTRSYSFGIRPVLPNKVTINGVTWATRNVDMPGTFAASPLNYGMFYQWDRNLGWSSIDPMTNSNGGTTWDTTSSTNASWLSTNDPSPSGFRVPTQAELNTLLDTTYVTYSWETNYNGSGINGALFTEISTGNTLFFPACGLRGTSNGNLGNRNSNGRYWSATPRNTSYSYNLSSTSAAASISNNDPKYGFSVRPVLA